MNCGYQKAGMIEIHFDKANAKEIEPSKKIDQSITRISARTRTSKNLLDYLKPVRKIDRSIGCTTLLHLGFRVFRVWIGFRSIDEHTMCLCVCFSIWIANTCSWFTLKFMQKRRRGKGFSSFLFCIWYIPNFCFPNCFCLLVKSYTIFNKTMEQMTSLWGEIAMSWWS